MSAGGAPRLRVQTPPGGRLADTRPEDGRTPARRFRALLRSATYRRWVRATTLGELVAFSVPTAVWAATAAARLDDRVAFVAVVVAGAGEGAILGHAQTRALRHDLPGLDAGSWVRATAAAGAAGWAVGMTPSTFGETLADLPVEGLAVLGVLGAGVLLGAIGAAQATLLRRHVERSHRWVAGNAAAWLAGLPVAVLALSVAPEEPAGARVALALAGGVGMGATVAAVTGVVLVELLRRTRTRPPVPLRRRAMIHLNHAHAWLYARSGGRLGTRVAGRPVLLLTTSGRRSGLPRRTPVQYARVDGDLVVIASAGGAPEAPSWWHNLDADPRVLVQDGAEHVAARAVTLGGEERERVWRELCARDPGLEGLQRRAGRQLPIVRLAPDTT